MICDLDFHLLFSAFVCGRSVHHYFGHTVPPTKIPLYLVSYYVVVVEVLMHSPRIM